MKEKKSLLHSIGGIDGLKKLFRSRIMKEIEFEKTSENTFELRILTPVIVFDRNIQRFY